MTLKHRERHDRVLSFLIIFFSLIAVLLSIFRQFDHDEFEHIHSAWYILQGRTPYLEFFQSHNPTLWFLLAPFIHFFGEGITVLFVARTLMLLFLLGIVWSVRNLSLETGASTREANYAVILVLSCSLIVNKCLEIRPDIPQVFFGLLSCRYFLRYLKIKKARYLALAGFLAGISFVFLQKSLLLLVVVGISMAWLLWREEISWGASILYVMGTLFPIAGLALYLYSAGCFRDYILTNWILNANQLKPFSPLQYFYPSLLENTAFWGLTILSLWTVLIHKKGSFTLQILSLWGVLLAGSLFFVLHPHKQYFIFFMALLSVPAARQLEMIFEKFKCSERWRSCLLVLALIAPCWFLTSNLANSNKLQLKKIRYVLYYTAPGQCIYDGDIQFNLFRPDLHYFWYSVKPLKELDAYNRISRGRFSSYDIYPLIAKIKPVFISDVSININDPFIAGMYQSTPFRNLYHLARSSDSDLNELPGN
jgi:hypothetical protein